MCTHSDNDDNTMHAAAFPFGPRATTCSTAIAWIIAAILTTTTSLSLSLYIYIYIYTIYVYIYLSIYIYLSLSLYIYIYNS